MTRQGILTLVRVVPMRCVDCGDTTETTRECPEGSLQVVSGGRAHAFETDDQAMTELIWSTIRPLVDYVRAEASADCQQYDKFLSPEPCGTCPPCRARAALTDAEKEQS